MRAVKLGKYLLPVMAVLMSVSVGARGQGFVDISTWHLKPFTEGMLVDAIGMVKEALDEADSSFGWLASSSESGDERVMVALPHDSMGDLANDPLAVLASVLSPEEGEQLTANLRNSVSHISNARYVMRPDLGRQPPDTGGVPPAAVITIELEIANGRNADFEAYVGNVIEATEATAPGATWLMMSPAFGTNNYLVVVLIPEWSMLDTPSKSVDQRVIEHFGERRGGQMVEASRSMVVGMKQDLWRTRPDLARPME